MSKLNKIIQRNEQFFHQGQGTILLGEVETDLIHEFLELIPGEQKLGIYTKQMYTFAHSVQLLWRQGYKIWTNLKASEAKLDPKTTGLKIPLVVEKEDFFALEKGNSLKNKDVYLAYGADPSLAQEHLGEQYNLAQALTQLPLKVGQSEVDLSASPLAQVWRLTQATNLVIFWPKSKEEFLTLVQEIQLALAQLEIDPSQVQVFYLGTNDSGIKTLASLLENPVRQLDNVARSRLFHSQANLVVSPKLANKSKHDSFTLASGIITSLPGVFSSHTLDKGTQLLLSTYADLSAGHNQHLSKLFKNYAKEFDVQVTNPNLNFLDYASGAGVISQYLAHLFAQQITNPQVKQNWDLIEVYAPALMSSAVNLQALSQGQLSFNLQAADSLQQALDNGLTPVFYREIITNPPFHQGNEVTFRITENLIAQARQRLHPQGALRLVANSGLPYLPILTKYFKVVEVIAQEAGFTVYLAKIS